MAHQMFKEFYTQCSSRVYIADSMTEHQDRPMCRSFCGSRLPHERASSRAARMTAPKGSSCCLNTALLRRFHSCQQHSRRKESKWPAGMCCGGTSSESFAVVISEGRSMCRAAQKDLANSHSNMMCAAVSSAEAHISHAASSSTLRRFKFSRL